MPRDAPTAAGGFCLKHGRLSRSSLGAHERLPARHLCALHPKKIDSLHTTASRCGSKSVRARSSGACKGGRDHGSKPGRRRDVAHLGASGVRGHISIDTVARGGDGAPARRCSGRLRSGYGRHAAMYAGTNARSAASWPHPAIACGEAHYLRARAAAFARRPPLRCASWR